MTKQSELIKAMIRYDHGDPKRIQHFLKVHSLAKTIGEMEDIPSEMLFILETASITHDIGIHISEEKYGHCSGKMQELEGPGEAETLLKQLSYPPEVIDRVCWLISHHHTYDAISSLDHQILVEADFLVNLYEDQASKESVINAYRSIFRTESGKLLCSEMFDLNESGDGAAAYETAAAGSPSPYDQAKLVEGYAATDRCVLCRTCIDVCPVQCISGARKPVYINQELCLHCGTCASVCDHNAILPIRTSR